MSEATLPGREVELRDSSRVLVRPIARQDKRRMLDAFERLSPESRYRRFLTPMERLTPRQLEYLTEVDHHDHEAMVAIDPENREMIEMLARLGRVHELGRQPGTVELGVELPPAEQGLGAELAELLRSAAAGVVRFAAAKARGVDRSDDDDRSGSA